jgi:peptide/nickel transport system substrate-binding protein
MDTMRIRNRLIGGISRAAAAGLVAAGLAMGAPGARAETVTIAQGVDPESLDPAFDTLISSVGIMMNIYDSLIWRDAKGNLVPALAESWDFPTPTEMRVKLRHNVKWHNGDPFTADDVVFSFERIFDPKSPNALLSSLKGFVDKVEKIDDYTVKITLPAPRATVVATLVRAPILPKKAFQAMGDKAFGVAPIGTGPFRFVRWDKNQQIVLERNPDYWRGPATVDKVVYRPIPEDFARFASLRNGEVDIIANLTSERADEIKKLPNLKIGQVNSVRNMFVGMNTKVKPFDDLRVRQALNYAVDKKALIDVVMGGYAVANSSVCTLTLFGATPVKEYEYDPAKAKKLLADAGYPNGFTATMLGPVGRYTKDKELQEAIAGMLADVGVKITHVQPEWAEFIKQWTAQTYPMHFVGTGNQVMDCDQHLGYRIDGKRYGRYYQSDKVDALIEKELTSYSGDERKKIFAEIQNTVRDDAPWIFLFDNVDLYGMSKRIDWTPRPDEMIWAYDIKVAK